MWNKDIICDKLISFFLIRDRGGLTRHCVFCSLSLLSLLLPLPWQRDIPWVVSLTQLYSNCMWSAWQHAERLLTCVTLFSLCSCVTRGPCLLCLCCVLLSFLGQFWVIFWLKCAQMSRDRYWTRFPMIHLSIISVITLILLTSSCI